MLEIFDLDIDMSTVHLLYANQRNRTSDKKVIDKVCELFVCSPLVYRTIHFHRFKCVEVCLRISHNSCRTWLFISL